MTLPDKYLHIHAHLFIINKVHYELLLSTSLINTQLSCAYTYLHFVVYKWSIPEHV